MACEAGPLRGALHWSLITTADDSWTAELLSQGTEVITGGRRAFLLFNSS